MALAARGKKGRPRAHGPMGEGTGSCIGFGIGTGP